MENFEKASRFKLRFATSKGYLSVEDLWDLSLASLDSMYMSLRKQQKYQGEESLLKKKTGDSSLDLSVNIISHIVKVKLEEKAVAKNKAEKQAHLATLKGLAASKQMEALGNQSLEDLEKMIKELEAEG